MDRVIDGYKTLAWAASAVGRLVDSYLYLYIVIERSRGKNAVHVFVIEAVFAEIPSEVAVISAKATDPTWMGRLVCRLLVGRHIPFPVALLVSSLDQEGIEFMLCRCAAHFSTAAFR